LYRVCRSSKKLSISMPCVGKIINRPKVVSGTEPIGSVRPDQT
jgi:hypothetical protein